MEVFILGRLRIAMHTKKLPITPRSTMVDHKLIWNTVAPNGWWRYSGKPGAVVCATLVFTADVLSVWLLYRLFMIGLFFLPARENMFLWFCKITHCYCCLKKCSIDLSVQKFTWIGLKDIKFWHSLLISYIHCTNSTLCNIFIWVNETSCCFFMLPQ